MRRAAVSLIASIALGSGCAPAVVTEPVIVPVRGCPQPEPPVLLSIQGDDFNSPENARAFLFNDDTLRAYVGALRETVGCYDAQRAAGERPVE